MSEELQPCRYEASALSSESTVVAEFLPEPGVHEATCHSEAALLGLVLGEGLGQLGQRELAADSVAKRHATWDGDGYCSSDVQKVPVR